MSEWRVWAIDDQKQRISTEESDFIIPYWEWDGPNELVAVLPSDRGNVISEPGWMWGWMLERCDDEPVRFPVQAHHKLRVYLFDTIILEKLSVPAGLIELLEEYLPTRPK